MAERMVKRSVAVAIGIACILLIAGMGGGVARASVAQGSNDGLQLTMTLEKTVYRLGEPIDIALTITNISNQTVTFGLGPDVNDFDFHVYNDTNSNIYWHSSIWIGSAIPMYIILIALKAGDNWSENFVWQQNMISSGTVSPGTYYIVGRVGPPYFLEENSTLETTPIQITILPILLFRNCRLLFQFEWQFFPF